MNMNQEKFDLTWHTYTDHLREMLHDMMTSNELTDVTLVSEDNKQFKAHKVVLSASSTVFKSIISENYSTNPVIYLRGILSYEIESILQFIYLGKATFYQERMNEFLQVGKSLEIKEINSDIGSFDNEEIDDTQVHQFEQTNEIPTNSSDDTDPHLLRANISPKQEIIKSNQRSKIQNDAEFSCDQCDKKYGSQKGLYFHNRSVHEGIRYPCDQCNYKATQMGHLQQHIKSVHEGIKYSCEQCNDKFSHTQALRRHEQNVHNVINQ